MLDDQGEYFMVRATCYKINKEFNTIWVCVYAHETVSVDNEIKRKDMLAVEQLMKMILIDNE